MATAGQSGHYQRYGITLAYNDFFDIVDYMLHAMDCLLIVCDFASVNFLHLHTSLVKVLEAL